jgi:predicted glycosyltransferase involved in capsule biosynthesis
MRDSVTDKITFLIPTFGYDASRLANLDFLLKKLSEITSNILVVEQLGLVPLNETPIQKLCNKYMVRHHCVTINDDRIHKSKIINVGVALCDTDYVWVNDADCYIKFSDAVPKIKLSTADFIQPYSICKYLDAEESNRLRNGESVKVKYERVVKREFVNPSKGTRLTSMYGGGMFVFKKKSFIGLGGMDERFVGWGSEDTDLCWRVLHSKYAFRCEDYKCVHLWHPTTKGSWRSSTKDDCKNNIANLRLKHNIKAQKEITEVLSKKYKEKNYSLAILAIGRSGTTLLSRVISDVSGAYILNEPFGRWGMATDRHNTPYGELLDSEDYAGYYRSILENIPRVKHHYIFNRNVLAEDRIARNIPDASEDLCRTRDYVIFVTRVNFLDFLTSFFLSNIEKNWNTYEYSHTQRVLPYRAFKNIYTIWNSWHNDAIHRFIKIRTELDKPYVVLDYEQIADPIFLKNFVVNNIPGANPDLFRIRMKKQKTMPNEAYIANYEEVKTWYDNIRQR